MWPSFVASDPVSDELRPTSVAPEPVSDEAWPSFVASDPRVGRATADMCSVRPPCRTRRGRDFRQVLTIRVLL